MPTTRMMDDHELLDKLSRAIGEWESSPYYIPEEEIFDLERFLVDHKALDVKVELETIYGTPLNQKFWSSFLAYHRLKRAREEIKAQDTVQDEKRQQYLQAMEEEKKGWQKWLKEWFHHHRRQQIKVLPGIVTDRDLKEAWASPATTLSVHELTYVLQKLTVGNIMTQKVITATPDMTIERAARIIHDHKIGSLPVVKNDKLIGIITTTDLMKVLLTALGMSDDTRRLSILVRDRSGALAEAGRCMQKADISLSSVMIVPLRGYQDVWQLILRVNVTEISKAVRSLEEAGLKVITDYVEDLSPYVPREQ